MAYTRYDPKHVNEDLRDLAIEANRQGYLSYGKKQAEQYLNIVHDTIMVDIAKAKGNGYKTVRERIKEKKRKR